MLSARAWMSTRSVPRGLWGLGSIKANGTSSRPSAGSGMAVANSAGSRRRGLRYTVGTIQRLAVGRFSDAYRAGRTETVTLSRAGRVYDPVAKPLPLHGYPEP